MDKEQVCSTTRGILVRSHLARFPISVLRSVAGRCGDCFDNAIWADRQNQAQASGVAHLGP